MTEGRGPLSECALRKLTAVVSWQEQSSARAGGAKLACLWPSEKSPRKEPGGRDDWQNTSKTPWKEHRSFEQITTEVLDCKRLLYGEDYYFPGR